MENHGQAPHEASAKALREIETLARLLDTRWRIPFTSFRFGLDPIAGLLPVAGDGAAGLVSAWIVMRAAQHGAPKTLIARMVANVVLDTAIGSIPILGSLFDFVYKANTRNVGLLRDHLHDAHRENLKAHAIRAGEILPVPPRSPAETRSLADDR